MLRWKGHRTSIPASRNRSGLAIECKFNILPEMKGATEFRTQLSWQQIGGLWTLFSEANLPGNLSLSQRHRHAGRHSLRPDFASCERPILRYHKPGTDTSPPVYGQSIAPSRRWPGAAPVATVELSTSAPAARHRIGPDWTRGRPNGTHWWGGALPLQKLAEVWPPRPIQSAPEMF